MQYVVATGVAAVLMWATVSRPSVRLQYYGQVALSLQVRGQEAAAAEALLKAKQYAPRT